MNSFDVAQIRAFRIGAAHFGARKKLRAENILSGAIWILQKDEAIFALFAPSLNAKYIQGVRAQLEIFIKGFKAYCITMGVGRVVPYIFDSESVPHAMNNIRDISALAIGWRNN